jgi:hypothetical protein
MTRAVRELPDADPGAIHPNRKTASQRYRFSVLATRPQLHHIPVARAFGLDDFLG